MKTSFVWKFFIVEEGYALCQVKNGDDVICKQPLKYGGSTSSLRKHLKSAHSIEDKDDKQTSSTMKQTTISASFLQTTKADELIARAVVVDGTSMYAIAKSKMARSAGLYHKVSIPTSASAVAAQVMKFFLRVRKDVKEDILSLKSQENKFSITTDEWANMISKERFITITLHSGEEMFPLGLIVSKFYSFTLKITFLF